MTEIPEGRCVVCRQAWEPCRRCRGQAIARKAEATLAANGRTRSVPKPRAEQRVNLQRDPREFPHRMAVRQEVQREHDGEQEGGRG